MIFTATNPAESESTKLGASRIRDLKTILNNTLGLLYTLSPVDSASGVAAPVSGGVSSTMLATNSVTTAKITDSNVTTAKIADVNVTTAKIADLNVTTAKINDLAVTTGKLAASAVTVAKITPGTNGQSLITSGGAAAWGSPWSVTANQSIGTGASDAINISVAHGLGAVPGGIRWVFVCTDAGGDAGYSQNDEVSIYGPHETAFCGPSAWADATNVGLSFINGLSLFLYHKSTQARTAITRTKWAAKAYVAK